MQYLMHSSVPKLPCCCLCCCCCCLQVFYPAIRSYYPALPDGALQPAYSGIRPKLSGPGQPAADFVIQGPQDHGVKGLVNLYGIESPGLTSSLAIGNAVADMLPRDLD